MFSWLNKVYTEGETQTPPAVPPVPPPQESEFTPEQQAKINAILAKEKNDFKKKLEEATKKAGNATELQQKIKELNDSLLTKEQLAAQEAETLKTEYENRLKNESEEKTAWATRFKTQTFDVEMSRAAAKHQVFDNGTQLGQLLQGSSQVTEVLDKEGKGTGKFKVMTTITLDGKSLTLPLEEAVGKLREAGQYPNQFHPKGSPGTGVPPGFGTPGGQSDGKGEVPPMDVAGFMKWRAVHK